MTEYPFGRPYHKIQTVFKRDSSNIIVPWDWTLPELEFLADVPWTWTEKVDGTNIRLHWSGEEVAIGGRTDNAQVPVELVRNLRSMLNPEQWAEAFKDCDDATVYGEGYGPKIQNGGTYASEQSFIVFDVRIGHWWLRRDDVVSIASQLGFDVVPRFKNHSSLRDAICDVRDGKIFSFWPGVQIEGLVGTPEVDLYNRRGERIIAKVKVKDWKDYWRKHGK